MDVNNVYYSVYAVNVYTRECSVCIECLWGASHFCFMRAWSSVVSVFVVMDLHNGFDAYNDDDHSSGSSGSSSGSSSSSSSSSSSNDNFESADHLG